VSGWWTVSYLVLWVMFVVVCVFVIGMLRQIGALQLQAAQSPEIIPVERDGPPIGSRLPDLKAETMKGFGPTATAHLPTAGRTLIMFLSPRCESCQHLVDPLNALAEDEMRDVHPFVVLQASEQACQEFLSVFPLLMPVVCDCDNQVTSALDVHRSPFGLLYSDEHVLIRKAAVGGDEHFRALLGDLTMVDRVGNAVFPPLVSSQPPSRAAAL